MFTNPAGRVGGFASPSLKDAPIISTIAADVAVVMAGFAIAVEVAFAVVVVASISDPDARPRQT